MYVVAATNRPDIIDPAMIRPGRLDYQLFVSLPTTAERAEILKTLTKKTPLTSDVDLALIARDSRARNFSGADLSRLIREATLFSLRKVFSAREGQSEKSLAQNVVVSMADFEEAFGSIKPSVSDQDRERYESLRSFFDIAQ